MKTVTTRDMTPRPIAEKMRDAGFSRGHVEATVAFFDHPDFVCVTGRERLDVHLAEMRATVEAMPVGGECVCGCGR